MNLVSFIKDRLSEGIVIQGPWKTEEQAKKMHQDMHQDMFKELNRHGYSVLADGFPTPHPERTKMLSTLVKAVKLAHPHLRPDHMHAHHLGAFHITEGPGNVHSHHEDEDTHIISVPNTATHIQIGHHLRTMAILRHKNDK